MAICEQVTELRDHLHAASRQGFDRPVDVESNQKRSHSSLGDRLPARFSVRSPFSVTRLIMRHFSDQHGRIRSK